MTRSLWAGAAALVALGVIVVALRARAPAGPKEAPDLVLPDLSGRVVRMRDLRGKVVVLNVWATWCLPCVEEMPTLEALHRKMAGRDFVVLAVSQDELPQNVAPWVRERGLTFPVLLDARGEAGYSLGVTGYPETFVVNRQGVIVHHHVGFRNWADPEMVGAIGRLLDTGEWTLTSR